MSSDNYENEMATSLDLNLLIISHSFHLWANLKASGLGPLMSFYTIRHGEKEAFTCDKRWCNLIFRLSDKSVGNKT